MPGLPQVVRYTEEELIQTAVIDIPAMSTDKEPINMLTYWKYGKIGLIFFK